jgi:hypothetical protein
MSAVSRAEGVVDIERPEARQTLRQRRVVLRLSGFEARVLEKQHVAWGQRRRRRFGRGPDQRADEAHRPAKQSLQVGSNGPQ